MAELARVTEKQAKGIIAFAEEAANRLEDEYLAARPAKETPPRKSWWRRLFGM